MVPTPEPTTTSILTPLSSRALRTPAWYAPVVPLPVKTSAVRRFGE